jgi:hypothetical protein
MPHASTRSPPLWTNTERHALDHDLRRPRTNVRSDADTHRHNIGDRTPGTKSTSRVHQAPLSERR